ncbi:MAG: hypothetical protein LQ352_003808 [Teloschistes flavicans]|nr:MAG: hypothetical protein LQ352_003808 [Teloschistes flavicans]
MESSVAVKQEILDACAAGNIDRVKESVSDTNADIGGDWIYHADHPSLHELMAVALYHRKAAVVEYLVRTFPKIRIDLYDCGLLKIALRYPDLDTFRVIYSHDPGVANCEARSGTVNTLIESCRSGDPVIPNFLLDHGVDPSQGGLFRNGCLRDAIQYDQPLDLIVKIVKCGGRIEESETIIAAQHGRIDVLRYLLSNGPYDLRGELLKAAHKTGNKEVISLVEERAKNLTKNEKKKLSELRKKERNDSDDGRKWQIWNLFHYRGKTE